MDGKIRSQINIGARVKIVEKHNQKTGMETDGVVEKILTNSPTHPRGIKVKLTNGKVGRVKIIL